MSELGMRKVKILSWLLQNVTLRRQVQRDQQCVDRQQKLHLRAFVAIKGIGRYTRLLPHAKILLVPISFFLYGVDYALEGSTFLLSKCDFSLLLHTERSWHTYPFTVVFLSGRRIFPLMKEHFFDLFWSVKLFIAAESGSYFSPKCLLDLNK